MLSAFRFAKFLRMEDVPKYSITLLDVCDAFADFVHLSSDVSAADVRVLLEDHASLLDFPCFC
jgi:hypothetical protein